MTDPITDMLNQIRNAQAVKKPEVLVPFSKLKFEIAKILTEKGFTLEAKKTAKGKKPALKIALKYENEIPAISGFKRVSKPGQRIYYSVHEIRKVKGGYGTVIMSTPKGLMAGMEARKQKLGGEALLEVW